MTHKNANFSMHYFSTSSPPHENSLRKFVLKVGDVLQLFILFSDLGVLSPGAFPSHQPVLDTPKLKADYGSYLTSSMEYGSNRIGKPDTQTA